MESFNSPQPAAPEYSTMNRGPHSLHESRNALDLTRRFEATTGRTLREFVDEVVDPSAPKAVFATGSLALGMGSSGSDLDLIVLVDQHSALVKGPGHVANSARQLEFSSASDLLLAGIFMFTEAGIVVEVQVVITPTIHRIYRHLRQRGPDLNEVEIRTLGRLNSGWLLWETPGYVERNAAILQDCALNVYCCTKSFVDALHEIAKARRGLASGDIPVALNQGREAVEAAYLAYFATEGLTYLGSKWPAQVGYARGAQERVCRYPLLGESISLLFPQYVHTAAEANHYLEAVREFLISMRNLIEQKKLYRIALYACPQVHEL
jgi:hypothetical protein